MATDCFPDGRPIGRGIDLGGHGPIGPRCGLPLNAVNQRRQFAKGGLIRLPLAISPRQVVQLCNAVRMQRLRLRSAIHTVSAVGGAHGGGGRELRDGDVVRVPVGSLWTERNNHVGPNAPDMRNNFANGDRSLDLIDTAVRVAQNRDLTNTEHSGGSSQFRLTKAAYFNRIAALSEYAESAPFSPCCGDEISFHTLSRVLSERSAEAERFIVGMSKNGQQFEV